MTQFVVAVVLGFVASAIAAGCPKPPTNDTVSLEKYMGTWFEIQSSLSFEKAHEKGLICTRAEYSLNSDGTVKVNNTGYTENNGQLTADTAIGKAKVVSGGKLAVSFFGPFYGPYWITQLYENAAGYAVSVVFSCSEFEGIVTDQAYWVLSRTPTLPTNIVTLDEIYANSEKFGINIAALKMQNTVQTCSF